MRHTNLERRGRHFYYRASFTLDGKVVAVRLALKTTDPAVAHELAGRMDRVLKGRWKQIVSEPADKIDEQDKASILRATALRVRDGLETLQADEQAVGHDDAENARHEHLRTLRGIEYVARDIFTNGIGPAFGSFDHFSDRFIQGLPHLDGAQLQRIREILDNSALLAEASQEGAIKALLQRNVSVTPANVVMARRQMMLGVLLALREAEQQALKPEDQIDSLLAALEMPPANTGLETGPFRYVVGGQIAADGARGMTGPAAVSTGAADFTTASPTSPVMAAEPAARTLPTSGTGALTIAGAAKAFLMANPKFDQGFASSRWTDKTRSQFEAAIFLAAKFLGEETPIVAVDETMVADLFRTLRRLPRNHHKTPIHGSMTLEAIAAGNTGDGLSLATTNRHIRFLKLIFDWATKRMTNAPVIDWSAFVEADSRVKRDKRDAFSKAELEAMFKGAIWHGSESRVRRIRPGPHIWHDAPYWVPILLVYTGARREEVCKALVEDIDCIDGVWVLRIRETETGRVKTASSVRDVPLADEVLRLGFLDFVEGQRQAGSATLFPELTIGGSTYGDAFYKKWWRALMRAGLVPEGKDIHSIRHFVATELADRDVSEERRADLLGHTITTSETARTYTKRAPLRILQDVVNTIPKVTSTLQSRVTK